MRKIPDILLPMLSYGSFSLPFVNYLLENDSPESWKTFARVFKHIWRGEYEAALQAIERALKVCESAMARDILMAEKLGISRNLGKPDVKLYKCLKKKLDLMSKAARNIALPVLINVEAFGISPPRFVRVWGREYEINNPTSSFLHLAKARKLAEQGEISKAISHYLQSYKCSKAVPHPSGMISALNGMAWRIRKMHPVWAYSISQRTVFWLGYYREEPGNLFGALDTLFSIEKYFGLASIASTAKIITSIIVPEAYVKLLEEVKSLVPRYDVSLYPNTGELRIFIKNMVGAYRKEKVSAGRLSEIINGKTRSIRGDTLRKVKKLPVSIEAPFPVYNEWMKLKIESQFKEAMRSIKDMSLFERKRSFMSTYMALTNRKRFYISRRDKFKETYKLLNHPEKFEEFTSKRYETMEFVIEMIKAHPYIEGRKATLRKVFDRIGEKTLSEFVENYVDLEEDEKALIDRFLRNYGRYYGVRFGIRLKGPDVVREFAKKYHLKIQPLFATFWCEEDSRVRKRLEKMMKRWCESGEKVSVQCKKANNY